MNNNKPVVRVIDGNLKCSVWKNPTTRDQQSDASGGGASHFYSARITRTYKDKAGQFRDSDRFNAVELLRVAHLAEKAYDQIVKLQADDRGQRRDGEADVEVVRDIHAPGDPEDPPF